MRRGSQVPIMSLRTLSRKFGFGHSKDHGRIFSRSHLPASPTLRSLLSSSSLTSSNGLRLGKHVREALLNDSPVVALESTVITHGLPEPENLSLAIELERQVAICCSNPIHQTRQSSYNTTASDSITNVIVNATPSSITAATVGIIKGQLVVGLSADEIEYLAIKSRSKPIKASRRDIPVAMAKGLSAGTTVSATMAIVSSLKPYGHKAHLSDDESLRCSPIKVFATGGTGGVHMGGESSMDISADLYEFARSPLGIVSSGFKSFLDTRRSLEFLETMGCTVMSLASADGADDRSTFPAFFRVANKDGVKSPCLVESVEEAANILFHCLEGPLANRRAALLAVPIPNEFSLDDEHERELEEAMAIVADIDKRTDLEGKEKTPLILEQLNRLTGGKTLKANIELLKNNARIGGLLAFNYSNIRNRTGLIAHRARGQIEDTFTPAWKSGDACGNERPSLAIEAQNPAKQSEANGEAFGVGSPASPVVVGCTMIDMHVTTEIDDRFKSNPRHSGVTFQGRPHLTLGGVGRNMATALEYLGHRPTFITAMARDKLAKFALAEFQDQGLGLSTGRLKVKWTGVESGADSESLETSSQSSSCFALVLMDSLAGQCEYVIANLEAVKALTRGAIEENLDLIRQAPLLVMDANLMDHSIGLLIERCHQNRVPIFVEPTDVMALPNLVQAIQKLKVSKPYCIRSLLCLSPNLIELERMVALFEQGQTQGASLSDSNDENKQLEGKRVRLDQVEQLIRKLMEIHIPQLNCLLVTMDQEGVFVAVRGDASNECSKLDQIRLMDAARQIHHAPPASPVQQTAPSLSKNLNKADACYHQTFHEYPHHAEVHLKHFPAPLLVQRPVSASGAGDSFAAGFISGLLANSTLTECLDKAFKASLMALQDRDTISSKLKLL